MLISVTESIYTIMDSIVSMTMDEATQELIEDMNPQMIQKIHENEETFDEFNCFGFAAAWFGWNSSVTYEDEETITGYLENHTHEVAEEEISSGDIVAWFEDGEISHIGIVISVRKMTYLAKMGGLELAIDDIIRGVYDYSGEIKYYKVN